MLKVGSKFYTFDDLSRRLEEFQQIEQVQLWVRDSRTVVAAAKRARRKSLNPALKYAELTYSCVFGGRRPSDQTKTHNQTSAGGCPFKVRLSTSIDGQALVVKEICHDHNHEPGKKLHEEPRRLYKNKNNSRSSVRKPVRYLVNKRNSSCGNEPLPTTSLPKNRLSDSTPTYRITESPFQNLQLHNQQHAQHQQQLQQHQLKLQIDQQLELRNRQQQKAEEILQLDSPDHIDTPDHLTSPDFLSTPEFFSSLQQLVTVNNSNNTSFCLPPSPISPSSSSSGGQTGYSSDEEELIDPILDLDVALEEALGDLDSVSSMDLEDKFPSTTVQSSSNSLGSSLGVRNLSSVEVVTTQGNTIVGRRRRIPSESEPSLSMMPLSASPGTTSSLGGLGPSEEESGCASPPPKRFRGRPRKTSTSSVISDIPDIGGFSDYLDFDVMLFQ